VKSGETAVARILIIEDSPTDTAVLTQLLERNGHQVLASASAEDGIDACKREQPDLVIMDVVLPGMNGFQATRALSRDEGTKAIPVLILSTKGMETDQAWGMRQGAKAYLVKPPKEDVLVGEINRLLGAAG
jgi:twitching motility two-component system response regulator PilH